MLARPAVALVILASLLLSPLAAENWPCWRGPRGDGTSAEQGIVTTWNVATGENIVWKVEIPGKGHSSPIVWGDRIFLVTCDEKSQERELLCLDRGSGRVVWQEAVLKSPLEKKHDLNSFASGTPATDGELVYVSFLEADFASLTERTPGNLVVAAYDFAGKQRWAVKPGRFASVHGFCSSPVLFENLVIVNGDHDGDSYLVALERATGKTVWKIPRENKTRSYCTPLIREIDGRTQMVLSGSKRVSSYDPRTGTEHWHINGPTEQFVASLVYNGKYLFITAGFPERHMLALKTDGKGDVTETNIVWRTTKACSYVPSPIAAGDYFLVTSDDGIGSCLVAESGDVAWRERMGKHYSGSPISASGLVYFTADDGITKVVKPGAKLDIVATSELGEGIYSSPAVSQGQLFLRGEKHLFCVGKK